MKSRCFSVKTKKLPPIKPISSEEFKNNLKKQREILNLQTCNK